MKSKAFAAQLRDTKFGHCALAPGGFVDADVAHIGEFPGLHVQVAVGQTGGRLHLNKSNRQAGNKGGQDAEATGCADHLVELKLHGVIYFVLRSISSKTRPVKRMQREKQSITLFYEVMTKIVLGQSLFVEGQGG